MKAAIVIVGMIIIIIVMIVVYIGLPMVELMNMPRPDSNETITQYMEDCKAAGNTEEYCSHNYKSDAGCEMPFSHIIWSDC
jgi:hypothetical protein